MLASSRRIGRFEPNRVSGTLASLVMLAVFVMIPGMSSPVQGATLHSEGFEAGVPPAGWIVVDNEGTGVVWGDLASPGCGGLDNFTNGSGAAACVTSGYFAFVEFDTELITPTFNFCSASNLSLNFTANYQNFAGLDFLDVDVSDDGGATWTNVLRWNEDHGSEISTPGEDVSLDISAWDGLPDVQIRFHYYDPNSGDWDFYVQVDDFELDGDGTVSVGGAASCDDDGDGVPDEDGDGVPDTGDFCPGSVIPESVPTRRLETNRFALVDGDLVFDTTPPNGKGPQRSFDTTDTGGCTCEQIIKLQGLGNGHSKFGCSISAMQDWIGLITP